MKNLILILFFLLKLLSCQTFDEIEDFVVIGGGLMGSSTAWELSKYGKDVLLIEQQDSVYTFGSSFGEARISRSLGPNEDIFSYLQQTSVSETKSLIDYLNNGKKQPLHSMKDIYTTSPVTYIYSISQIKEVEELLDGQTDTYEYASNALEAAETFGMKIPDTSLIIREFKDYSGTLNPKVLINKLHRGIKKSGNRVQYNQKVTSLKKEDDIYIIEITNTKTGLSKTVLSKKVVAAAGPYNGALLKEIAPYISKLIVPKRLFLSFIKINSKKYNTLSIEQKGKLKESYPVAYLNSEIFYSMIEKYDKDENPLFKIGAHLVRTDIKDLDDVWKLDLTAEEIQWSKENTIDYFNKLDLPVEFEDLEYERGYSCVYSLTQTEIPYVSNALKNDLEIDSSLVIDGGMAGFGAKGSLAYGIFAADLVLGNEKEEFMYQKAKTALGSKRLIEDVQNIDK